MGRVRCTALWRSALYAFFCLGALVHGHFPTMTLDEVVKFNSRLRPLYADKSIIFVGSSGSLRGRKLGYLIDKFDVVVRVNDPPVRGFEEDVGSKTTHQCLASARGPCASINKCPKDRSASYWARNAGAKLMLTTRLGLPYILKVMAYGRPTNFSTEEIECAVKQGHTIFDVWLDQKSKLHPGLQSRVGSVRSLRTGLCCLFAFLTAELVPYIVGFDLECKPNLFPEHYYSPVPINMCMGTHKIHNYYSETKVLAELVEAGVVKMLPTL